ncbi:GAD1 (YMR250W) [Zygosaccharomyces parabailii]|nr:GAD1 (YMR250W) [Zygosaccharomyces parabailii]
MLHKHTRLQKHPRTLVERHHSEELEDTALLPEQLNKLQVSGAPVEDPSEHAEHLHYNVPQHGVPEQRAYELIHNELTLDGNPHLNLASFVNTSSTELARKLIMENVNKNLADNDEYPQLIELTQRCISMISQMWKCDERDEPIGCATTGSSEAIMLGGLAMKKRWEGRMRGAGKSTARPNIIMSSACQVALEKFARYFEVEAREVPVSSESHHSLDTRNLWDFVDENTIGIFVILGTTYTGHFESIENVSDVLTEIEAQHPDWANKDIPIHVDGASGGFVVPFSFTDEQMAKTNNSRWGFHHPRVVSMNTSGHKFGLTTPGLGWVLWKSEHYLPEELRFKLKYLGGVEETFGLNFSRPGFQVVHQYYNFISLGYQGYASRFARSLFVARSFSFGLLHSEVVPEGAFEVVSSIHLRISDGRVPQHAHEYWEHPDQYTPGVPLVAFKLSEKFHKQYPEIPQSMISGMLRSRGWIMPNYPLPHSTDGSDKLEVLRVVFRSEMSLDLALMLLQDVEAVLNKAIKSYNTITHHVQNLHSVDGRTEIYKLLSALSSPDTEDTEPEPEEHKHLKKNYRGTC